MFLFILKEVMFFFLKIKRLKKYDRKFFFTKLIHFIDNSKSSLKGCLTLRKCGAESQVVSVFF